MIDINNKNPWSLNSDSICPSFLDVSASYKLNNQDYWRINFNFEFLNYNEERKVHLISLHPSNLGVFFHKNHAFILLHQKNNGLSIFTQLNIYGKRGIDLNFEHFPHDKIVLTIDNQTQIVDISSNPLDYTNHRNFYIGSDTHDNDSSEDIDILRIHDLKIYDEKEMVAIYQWRSEDWFDYRVKDITGNDNFLFKVK
jgi:hypothetical protein